MANYVSRCRTNYFHVSDEEEFLAAMSTIATEEDDIDTWTKIDRNGQTMYAFGCNGSILGIRNPELDPESDEAIDDLFMDGYDRFLKKLQSLVANNDAIIIFESGYEKLRYIVGSACVITSDKIKSLDMTAAAQHMAAEMLGNPDWTTQCEY